MKEERLEKNKRKVDFFKVVEKVRDSYENKFK